MEYKKVLSEVLEKVEPSKEEIKEIKKSVKEFILKLKGRISNLDIEVFVGGSFAKNTLIKKDKYDVDIFLRFGKDFEEEDISKKTERLLKGEKFSRLHGSRDYFEVKINSFLVIEIIPVMRVKTPEDSNNITDLSYSHVKYINKKIKNKSVINDIKIAKAFCYANNCYGAESYIQGFSGYSLELLVYYYGGFIKLLEEVKKIKEKIVIDIEKQFKNKQEALLNLNSSKLNSKIILIDPTYKQRNVLAALSIEQFKNFQKVANNFLKNPSIKFFEIKKQDIEKIKQNSEKRGLQFISLEVRTQKEGRDVEGSKLLKFYNHLKREISKEFYLKNSGFEYFGNKKGVYFFVVSPKKEVIFKGPFIKDNKNIKNFKKKHKKTFIKGKKIYAKEHFDKTVKEFFIEWINSNDKKIKEMYINEITYI
jgi:tRNA nucleotidyltransferase (CCA-adding enzyme)